MENKRQIIARELHKQARVNFPRRHVELKGISDLFQADLVEMIPFFRVNKGYKYIMTIIDCFTKFATALPLKTKKGVEVRQALAKVLKNRPMKHLQTDQGTEWFNTDVKSILTQYNVNHYFTFSEIKASIVERFNRTLKNMMYRIFSERGNYRWLDILPKIVKEYNNKVHRSIGVKPVDVTKDNEKEILLNLIRRRKTFHNKAKFDVGDSVRISRLQKTFHKGYKPRWSNEIFTVHLVKHTSPVTYVLKDYRGEILKGCFYQEELSKTKYKDDYLIEKVIRRKGDKLLVRWLGFDKTHDSWVNKSDLIK